MAGSSGFHKLAETIKSFSYGPTPLSTDSQILVDYLPKLIRLAEKNISAKLRQKVDADDVGATVIRTVIRRAGEGKLEIEQSEDFWRLLVAITLNKVRKKARYWKAQKRDIGRESALSVSGLDLADLAVCSDELLSEPTEEQADACVDLLNRLTCRLNPKCVEALNGKLNGLSTIAIAEKMDVAPRSVRRYLSEIQAHLSDLGREEN